MTQTTKKYIKVIINLFIALLTILFVVFILPLLINYFMPFLVGAVIAAIANPLVHFFEEKMKIKRKAGTVVVIILVIGAIIFIGYLIVSMLVTELVSFINGVPDIWKGLESDLLNIEKNWSTFLDKLPVNIQSSVDDLTTQLETFMETFIGTIVSTIGTPTVEAVGNFAKHVPSAVIAIVMCLLSAYFFIADRESIIKSFHTYVPRSIQKKWDIFKDCLKKAVGGYFKAQFKIEIWIYILLVIGFMILQVDYLLLIALGLAFLDFLPFFGTGIVMIPWAVIKFLSGDYRLAIGLMIIWGVGLVVRQIISPKIMGDSVGMPAIPTLFLLFFGYKLAGVIGMILAVPLGIIAVNLFLSGMFETTTKSIRILICGINNFRRLDDFDMAEVSKEKKLQTKAEENQKINGEDSAKK